VFRRRSVAPLSIATAPRPIGLDFEFCSNLNAQNRYQDFIRSHMSENSFVRNTFARDILEERMNETSRRRSVTRILRQRERATP
jgi:hypothetical protein